MAKVASTSKVSNTDNPVAQLYKVKAKGYSEQFSSYTVAKRNFDSLKRKAVKNEQAFTIVLLVKNGSAWEELEKASISGSFYENE